MNKTSIEIVPASPEEPPFPVEARVYEEDTWRLLNADTLPHYPQEHPIRLMTETIFQEPLQPGTILLSGSSWHAVVVDIDAISICEEAWVEAALQEILRLAAEKQITALGLPLLGTNKGNLYWQQSLGLTLEAIRKHTNPYPRKIWLITPPERIEVVEQMLKVASIGDHRKNHDP